MQDTACTRRTAHSTSLYAHARRLDGLGLVVAPVHNQAPVTRRVSSSRYRSQYIEKGPLSIELSLVEWTVVGKPCSALSGSLCYLFS
jgi:hypothetical protein